MKILLEILYCFLGACLVGIFIFLGILFIKRDIQKTIDRIDRRLK